MYIRQKIWNAALEIYTLRLQGTCGGMSRKLAEIERHISNGGKLNEGGVWFSDSSRKGEDSWLSFSIDFFHCLDILTYRQRQAIYKGYGTGEMTQKEYREFTGAARLFWGEVRRRGLYSQGKWIVQRMTQ